MKSLYDRTFFRGVAAVVVVLMLIGMGWHFARGYSAPEVESTAPVAQSQETDEDAREPIIPIETRSLETASPAGGAGSIIVHVYTRDGDPVSNCNVRLAGAGRLDRHTVSSTVDTFIRELPTDEKGVSTFSELPLDVYVVSAYMNNFGGTGKAFLRPTRQVAEIEIILGPGGYLSGVVTLEDGTPCEGARIFPVAQDGYLISEDSFRALSVVTDEQGRFHMPFLSARLWDLSAEYPGYRNSGEKSIPVGSDDIRLVMRPGARLSGKVVDPERGEGVAGMLLVASQEGVLVNMRSVTDEAGNFEFAGMLAGEVKFLGFHPTYALVQTPSIAVAHEDDDGAARLEARPGAQVFGRLLDSGGSGLGDIRMGLGGPSDGRSAVSDAEGVYRFENVLPGNYMLGTLAAPSGEVRYIQVAAGVTTNVPDWILNVRALRGIVVDGLGSPVANANVQVSKESLIGGVRTEDDGEFIFVEPGVQGEVKLSASVLRSSSAQITVDMGAEEIPFVTLVLDQPRGMLGGKVVDQHGRPVKASLTFSSYQGRPDGLGALADVDGAIPRPQSDATVPHSGGVAWDLALDTDSEGYFLAHVDTPSDVKIVVSDFSPHKTYSKSPPVAEVHLNPGQVRTDLRLVLPSRGRDQIAGKVVDSSGVPLPKIGLNVVSEDTLLSNAVVSNSSGEFLADGLSGSTFEIQVRAQGFHPFAVKGISAGSKNVLVSLRRPAKVFGTVIDREANSPVASFNIALVGWQVKDIHPSRFLQVADAGGHFEIDAPQGSDGLDMEIAVQAPGYEFSRTGVGRIPLDSGTGPIQVVLEPGAPPIKGIVVDEMGHAVGGARVTANSLHVSWDSGLSMSTISDSDGTFQIAGLPNGVSQVEITHPDFASVSLEIESSSQEEVRITMAAGGDLEGWVTSGGVPLDNVAIRIAGSTPVTTDFEGHFQAEQLPEGETLVEIQVPGTDRSSSIQTITTHISTGISHSVHIEISDGVASIIE